MPRLVCDSSVLVTALLGSDTTARWARDTLDGCDLCAPDLVRFEVANIIRRHESAAIITVDQATMAHGDLVDLPIEEWPYVILAERVWQLRSNLTAYDASYVALAERLDVPLVTLDRRLARAPGITCQVLIPTDQGSD